MKDGQSKSIAIIGGGPIGMLLAIKLAKRGTQVEVFEKSSWPIDKVCGQGLMAAGREQLSSVGVEFTEGEDSYLFSSIEYIDQKSHSFKAKLKGEGLGINRKVLSEKLYNLAKAYPNIKLHSQSQVIDISLNNSGFPFLKTIKNKTSKQSFNYVVCCDGLNSSMRKKLNMEKLRSGPYRYGARVHYRCAPWSDGVQVYWSDGLEAYVTPVDKETIEIAFLWFEGKIDKGANLQKRLLANFPQLCEKLGSSQSYPDFKGYGPFSKYSKSIQKGSVFFLGDAYCFLDGITGEGLSIGFRAAHLLDLYFEKPDRTYLMQIKLIYLNYSLWVKFTLLLSRFKRLRRLLFSLASKRPVIFEKILKMNSSF